MPLATIKYNTYIFIKRGVEDAADGFIVSLEGYGSHD
jgi:hypothetical protein